MLIAFASDIALGITKSAPGGSESQFLLINKPCFIEPTTSLSLRGSSLLEP